MAVGEGGITHWSSDLANWHTVQIAGVNRLTRIGFGLGIFAAIEEGTGHVFTSVDGEGWFETTLLASANYGVYGSGNDLWISGENGLLWKWNTPEAAFLTVQGEFDDQKRFKLNITSTDWGKYRIFSAASPNGPTWIPRDLISVTNVPATWIEPNTASGPHFYFLRKEE